MSKRVFIVVPDTSVTHVNLVVVFRPEEPSSFVLDGVLVDQGAGSAVTVVHSHLDDTLLLVSVRLLFP